MKKKILLSFILVIFCVFSVFSEGQDEGSTWKGAPVTIKFYGSTAEYNQLMLKAFAEVEPNIKVEIVPVDFNNAPQIIKTGIASGNPVDVSFFWGSAMKTFTDAGMAHDLTPYLMANNKKWYNTFVPKFIDAGIQNGKYYAISYQPVIETLFVNEEIFKKFNLKYPETVDEMMETAAFLKTKGIYAFGCWNGMHHQMLVWAYQIYANNGTLEKVTKGQLPFAGPNETPGLRENLELLKKMHEAGYLYPGEGALTVSKEQLQAGWYEGKIAMHFDANSDAGKYETEAPFKVWAIPFPLIKKGGKYGVNVITNALFIPANAKNKEAAVTFMKFYTSPTGQAITNDSGRPPSTKLMQESVQNPLVKEILAHTRIANSVGYDHLQNISSAVNTYIHDIIGEVVSGGSIDAALAKLEKLRLEAIQK